MAHITAGVAVGREPYFFSVAYEISLVVVQALILLAEANNRIPDFNLNDKIQIERIKEFVLSLNPALVGISLMSVEYNYAKTLTEFIKKTLPIPVIWGGIHPTIAADDCLCSCDYVCIGEGEKAMLDIAKAVSRKKTLYDINNLAYVVDRKVIRNPLNPLMDNLDEAPYYGHIPKNAFILFGKKIVNLNKKVFRKYDRYGGKFYSIITTRGCPFSCTYCCNNVTIDLYKTNKIRKRNVPSIIKELERALAEEAAIEYINFHDDCFLVGSDEYFSEFCEIYKKKIKKPFIIRSIPIYITEKKIKFLKDAGLSWISLGLQSGSDRTCTEIYKRKSLKEDFLKAARVISDFKVAAFYDVILDNPFETENDLLQTVDTLIKTPKPFYVQFLSLVFYKGTQIHVRAKTEYPNLMEDYMRKDYLVLQKNILNTLVRLSAFVNPYIMSRLIYLYRKYPKAIKFKIILSLVNMLNLFFFEPRANFHVIWLSQYGSFLNTLRVLPIYFKQGIIRYVNQFKQRCPFF